MPKYELSTTAEVPSYDALRSYVGKSDAVSVSAGADRGVFTFDPTDTSTADDGADTIVGHTGKRWKRVSPPSTFLQSGTGAVARTFSAKARDDYTARDFGAVADDSTDDAAAIQKAQDAASTRQTINFGNGVYRLKAGATSPFHFANLTSNDIYRAIKVDKSDITFKGGRFHIVSRDSVAAGDVQPAFCSDKNTTIGTLENITFDGVEINTENDADATNSNQRGLYLTGVRGLELRNTKALSTGTRRGYYAHIQNCDNVQILGHRHRKMTGGINLRFCNNVVIGDCIFDDFSEAIDFDGASWVAVLNNITFRSTQRTNQCLDLNSMVDAVVSNITVKTVGNIATISYKTTTPPNFSDYINNVTPSSFTPTERVTISGVSGQAVGTTSLASFIIGTDWAAGDHVGSGPVSDIVLENVSLKDVSYIQVYEAKRLTLRNISLTDVIGGSPVEAINMQSFNSTDDRIEWSDLDVTMERIEINGCQRGAVSIGAPSKVVIGGLKVRGSDTEGTGEPDLRISSLESRGADVSIDGLDLEDVVINGDSTAIGTWAADTDYPTNKVIKNGGNFYVCTVGGTSDSSGGPTGTSLAITDNTCTWKYLSQPYKITWGGNNRLSGTLLLQGDAHKYIHGRTLSFDCGDIAATGAVSRMLYVAKRRCYVARATYATAAAVTADGTNLRALTVKSIQGGGAATSIAQVNTIAGWAAYTEVDGGFAVSEAGALLNPGDTMYVDFTSSGTGKALTGLMVQLEVLDL